MEQEHEPEHTPQLQVTATGNITPMVIGEIVTRKVSVHVCMLCDNPINSAGLCHVGCNNDRDLSRPKGTVTRRVFSQVNTLLSQEVI